MTELIMRFVVIMMRTRLSAVPDQQEVSGKATGVSIRAAMACYIGRMRGEERGCQQEGESRGEQTEKGGYTRRRKRREKRAKSESQERCR